jgi:hypothetical protein
MATASEEPNMRKIIGLFILALTSTAATAQAQGLFLDKGQPGVGVAAGGAVIGNAWTVSVIPTYTYRGIFDVGIDVTRYAYTKGDANHLSAIGAMPFANVYFARAEEGNLPISLSGTLGIQKRIYMGNGPVANPDGWGLLMGVSAFRRLEASDTFAIIPEVFVAYDLSVITWHSTSIDGKNGDVAPGQVTNYGHKARLHARANMAWKSGDKQYIVTPYGGYQAGLAYGANVGIVF